MLYRTCIGRLSAGAPRSLFLPNGVRGTCRAGPAIYLAGQRSELQPGYPRHNEKENRAQLALPEQQAAVVQRSRQACLRSANPIAGSEARAQRWRALSEPSFPQTAGGQITVDGALLPG